jgi:hypothetical protein
MAENCAAMPWKRCVWGCVHMTLQWNCTSASFHESSTALHIMHAHTLLVPATFFFIKV